MSVEKQRLEITLQPKQKEALKKSEKTPVLFYGGAKGGGKSYLVRAREVYRRLKYPNTKGLIVRKTYPELLSNHIRMMWREYPWLHKYYRKGEKVINWPNGSMTEFSHLKSTEDVYLYQGREYEDIAIDEITQHQIEVFKILRSSLRTTNKEFVNAGGIPTFLLTGNPGGIGHGWVKRIFVDRKFLPEEHPNHFDFVQAKVRHNKALMDIDPEYVKRLEDLPEDKRRAYLDGDWDVFSGQVFSEFRRKHHVITPIIPNPSYKHFLSIDWGYSEKSAFAAYAHAVIPMKTEDGENFNRIVTYQEWYGNQKYPDEWAGIIKKTAKVEKFIRGYTDPSMHNPQSDGSVPLVRLFDRVWKKMNKMKRWMMLDKGSRNRIARVASVHNWLSMAPDDLPYWVICSNCINLIRSLPLLVYDEHKVEDVDTSMDDHCLTGDTLVDLDGWQMPIKDLVGMSGKLWSYNGPGHGFENVRCTGTSRVYEVSLMNGKKVKCTSYHPFLTTRGWVLTIDLRSSDMILCLDESKCDFTDYSRVQWTPLLQMRILFQQTNEILQRIKAFTQNSLGISQRENSKREKYSSQGQQSVKQSNRKFGTSKDRVSPWASQFKSDPKANRSEKEKSKDSDALAQYTSWKAMAPTTRQKVTKIRYLGREKVYNLDVPGNQCFSVNGGILVHNSYDSCGYFLSSVKFIGAGTGSILRPGKKGKRKIRAVPTMPVTEKGEVMGIDPDAFEIKSTKERHWTVV